MATIDTSSWKEFKLSDLFDIEDTWIYGKNKQYVNKYEEKINNSIAVVSGVTVNNGVNYYTDDKVEETEIYCDCLTISTRGEYSGSVFYHDYPFVLANNILVMPMPNISKEAKLFIGSVIQKLPFGGYANYPTKDKLKECIIKLPVKEVEEIDFEYMEKYIAELEGQRIAELEGQRIAELEGYLVATGLSDYVLTEEDKQILSFNDLVIKSFKLSDLFNVITPIKRFNANSVIITENIGHPYVVRSSQNNGVRGYINENEKYLNEGNTFSFGQDTATVFWQDKPYFTGDKIKVLKPLFECNEKLAQYFQNRISIAFSNFSWGTQSFKISVLEDMCLDLPIQAKMDSECKYHQDGYIPNFDYMEKYIKAIEKLVISDVVKYKDEVIEKTKEIINNPV